MKTILHVGCGSSHAVPAIFQDDEWVQVRLDIDPSVAPDVVASITKIPMAGQSVDGVYSSHNLEHLYAHEVPLALREFFRVLRPGGSLYVAVPDVEEVAKAVAADGLDSVLYESPAGPITAADILWGLRSAVAQGNVFYQHRTGFTGSSLSRQLREAGFDISIVFKQDQWSLAALAVKPT